MKKGEISLFGKEIHQQSKTNLALNICIKGKNKGFVYTFLELANFIFDGGEKIENSITEIKKKNMFTFHSVNTKILRNFTQQ